MMIFSQNNIFKWSWVFKEAEGFCNEFINTWKTPVPCTPTSSTWPLSASKFRRYTPRLAWRRIPCNMLPTFVEEYSVATCRVWWHCVKLDIILLIQEWINRNLFCVAVIKLAKSVSALLNLEGSKSGIRAVASGRQRKLAGNVDLNPIQPPEIIGFVLKLCSWSISKSVLPTNFRRWVNAFRCWSPSWL